MAFPTVVINSAGSNTTASGAGPTVALTGVLAATHTNTTVNITDVVDLSGVAVDGSAALWVATASGRRWSGITGISGTSGNWTVTVATAYAGTASGLTWGIGGKRATCAGSLQLFLDMLVTWTIDIQTDETTAVPIVIAPTGGIVTSSNTFALQPTLTVTTNITLLDVSSCANLRIDNLHLKSTFATPTAVNSAIVPISGHAVGPLGFSRLVIEGFYDGLNGENGAFNRLEKMSVANCEIKNCTNYGIHSAADTLRVVKCNIHNNAVYGLYGGSTGGSNVLIGNVFRNNGINGARLDSQTTDCIVVGNDFSNNTTTSGTGAGLTITSVAGGSVVLEDNIFWGNTNSGGNASGINCPAITAGTNRHNAYGGNTTSALAGGITAGEGDITLTADPSTSSSDAGLNSTAGGGVLLKGVATFAPNATANTPGDIGAIPTGGGGSGGGSGSSHNLVL